MIAVQTQDAPLMEFGHAGDPATRGRGGFPVYRDTGTASTAVVYFELEPGHRLGRHVDSAEEVLVILAGTAEAVVGEERAAADAGALVVVPAMVPHEVINTGDETLRVAGVFASNTVVSIFDEEIEGAGTRVIGTPPPPAAGG
jgi:quercetin dioxygenase-like cupin family protein